MNIEHKSDKGWEEELEKLMELDVMSYSTMSGHPKCKIDPYELREFIKRLLSSQAEEMERALEKGMADLDTITQLEKDAILSILKQRR